MVSQERRCKNCIHWKGHAYDPEESKDGEDSRTPGGQGMWEAK